MRWVSEHSIPYRCSLEDGGLRVNAIRPTWLIARPPLKDLKMSKSKWKYRLHLEGEAHVLWVPDPWLVLTTGEVEELMRDEGPENVEFGGPCRLNGQWSVGTAGCTDFRWYVRLETLDRFGPEVRPGVFPGAVRVTRHGDYESWIAL